MNGNTWKRAPLHLLASLSFLSPVSAVTSVAGETSPASTDADQEQQALLEELNEVLVSGEKPVKSTQQIINWLAELGGKFSFEGNVDLRGNADAGDLKPVTGSADCVAFGLAPGIRCELKVRWPESRGPGGESLLGGISALDPGMMLFGIEPRTNGITHMLVDSKGVGEHAVGLLFNNTLVSKTRCLNVPGVCERVVRITIEPDAQVIRMQIDLERDYRKAVRYGFVMRRVPGSRTDVLQGKPK